MIVAVERSDIASGIPYVSGLVMCRFVRKWENNMASSLEWRESVQFSSQTQ